MAIILCDPRPKPGGVLIRLSHRISALVHYLFWHVKRHDSRKNTLDKMGDAMWITLKKGQRVKLQASGETVAAVHGTAIGQDGAGITVEAFDRRGPASARPVRFFPFASWFGNRVMVTFGLRGAYDNFAAIPLWA